MKFQEPDLRGMSLEELRNRNRAAAVAEAPAPDTRQPARTPKPPAVPVPALTR